MGHKPKRARVRPGSGEPQPADRRDDIGNRSRWRLLTITTLITAAVTAVVTLAFSGIAPLWRKAFPEPPITVQVDHHQPPVPVQVASAPNTPKARSVRVKSSLQDTWPPAAWALPTIVDPATTPKPEDLDEFEPDAAISAWATRAGGAEIGTTRLRVTVTGQDKDVVIDGLCAHLVGPRTAPLSGTLLTFLPDGDDPEPASLNLDSDKPCAPELSAAPVHVEAHKNVVIDVSALTRAHTVTWYPEIRLVVDGKRQSIPIEEKSLYRTTSLLDDLAAYGRYFNWVVGASPVGFMESLPDPSLVESIDMATYGTSE